MSPQRLIASICAVAFVVAGVPVPARAEGPSQGALAAAVPASPVAGTAAVGSVSADRRLARPVAGSFDGFIGSGAVKPFRAIAAYSGVSAVGGPGRGDPYATDLAVGSPVEGGGR